MTASRKSLLSMLITLLSATVSLGQSAGEIRVNISQKDKTAEQTDRQVYVDGYRKTIRGQRIQYRSSHPDAEEALLVRARKDVGSITWETDIVPGDFKGNRYRFIWLAGLEREGFQNLHEVHSFDLLVNGTRWFSFQNRKDSTATDWHVSAPNGSVLSFRATTIDRVGDLFGMMVLEIPKELVPSGKPLTLAVEGEDAGSADWYMTFQYSFARAPRVRIEPVVRRELLGESQLVRLSLDNLETGKTIEVFVGNRQIISKPLEIGPNIVLIPIAAVRAKQDVPLSFTVNGIPVSRRMITVAPVKKRDVYLLSYSHNDIGYTDLQPAIERKQWKNLDDALRIIGQTGSNPAGAQFKWNMEVLWGLEGYLRQCTEAGRSDVIRAIRGGNIGLNALYANVLTGLANAPEMNQFTAFARSLKKEYGLEITTALVSDIPGFTWGIVSALAHSGVKYFSIAPNPGDRIGGTIEKLGDRPFYWSSQSGEEKILTWVASASYASFHEGDITKLGDEKVFKLMRSLEEKNYPYEIVHLPYTIGGDNGPPDAKLPDFVKQWNERYVTPRLVIATHQEMFTEFERRYGATLPTYAGDFTPYWEDGAASSALETALNRNASDRLLQAEALWAIKDPFAFPEQVFRSAWRNVVLYDEHTWGAHNSVSEPDLPFVTGQWAIKRKFAMDADSISRDLMRIVLANVDIQQKGASFDVTNTQSWPRTDLVILTAAQSAGGDIVVDADGRSVPSQRLSTGELAVLVQDIAPMATSRFSLRKGSAGRSGDAKAAGNSLENSILSLTVDASSGSITTLKWKRNGVNLVDTGSGEGLNAFLYVSGKDAKSAKRLANAKVRIGERGGLVASLFVEADAPGCRSFLYEVRIVDGLDRVDIVNRIDKQAIRTKEAVHFAFPFDIAQGQLRYDVALGIVRPEIDQIPGSCKNFFSVQSWVDISNDQRGVTWATLDAPLIEIGAMTAELPWMTKIAPAQNFYSYAMNNYWHTNYKADQEGLVEFRFSLRPHGEYDQAEAVRFGLERRQPLIVSSSTANATSREPLFNLHSSPLVVLSAKPAGGDGSWLLQVYNPTEKSQTLVLQWRKGIPVTTYRSDVSGSIGEQFEGGCEIVPYGSMYVRAKPK